MRAQVDGGGGGGKGIWFWFWFHADAGGVGVLSAVAMDTAGCEAAAVAGHG